MPTTTKELIVKRLKNYPMYEVGYEGGGEVPKELKASKYTSISLAQSAIDSYKVERARRLKEKRNGSKTTKRGIK